MNKLPANQPLTVIPADEQKSPTLNWTCRERLGCPISRLEDGVPVEFKPGEDLTDGQEILVSGLFGGYHPMKVTRDKFGVFHAESGNMMAVLTSELYEENNEPIWICAGLINKRGLERLKIVKETST